MGFTWWAGGQELESRSCLGRAGGVELVWLQLAGCWARGNGLVSWS